MKNINYLKRRNNSVHVGLDVFIYREDDQYLAYAPALDIFGYGNTTDDAKRTFTNELEIYLDHTIKDQTLEADLKNLGWKKRFYQKSAYKSPDIEEIKKKSLPLLNIDQNTLVECFKKAISIAV